MSAAIDFDALAGVLRRTGELSALDVALGIAAAGVPVLPTVPGDKAPMLTTRHIDGTEKDTEGRPVVVSPPCDACRAAGLRSAGEHGATTDPATIGRYWMVHPDAGVGMKAHPQLVRGDGDHADGAALRKSWKAIGYGEPNGEPLPFEASTPGGAHRRRYLHTLPDGVAAPGGGTSIHGVSWYGLSGYVVVHGMHPTAGTMYPPFHGTITPLPVAVCDVLRDRRAGAGAGDGEGASAATSATVSAFIARHTGTGDPSVLDRHRIAVEQSPPGERHPTAVARLTIALREAVAGLVPAAEVVRTIRAALAVAGWSDDRLGREYDDIVRWAVGQVEHLTPEQAAAEIAERDARRLEQAFAPGRIDPETGEIIHGEREAGDEGMAGAWRPVDLAAAWNGDRCEPAAAVLHRCDGMALYPPGINYLYGDSGDGKTWVMQMAAVQAMKAGQHVIWVTYEDANELEMVKRLRLLGATAADLEHLSLIVANEPFLSAPIPLARLARKRNTALLVLDSVGEALAVDGVDEDKDAQFAPWARDTLRCIIDLAAGVAWRHDGTADNERLAVVPIDHSTKAKDNPFFPSGTKRKRSMLTGLMLMVNVRQAFAIGRVGRVQLIASKDRSGRFRRGEIVAEVVMDATADAYGFTIEPPPTGAEMATVGKKRTADERVMQALDLSGVALSAEQIVRQVNHPDNRLPGEADLSIGTVKNALTRLAKRPNVSQQKVPTGVGKAHRHLYLITNHKDDTQGEQS
jgi:hypothetical protein